MYLHLGQDVLVSHRAIIGIFDLDTTTTTQITRDFLSSCEKNKKVINISENLPKSFVLCGNKKENSLYISQLSTSTLLRRSLRMLTDDQLREENPL